MTVLLVSRDIQLYMQTVKFVKHHGMEVKRCSIAQLEDFLKRHSVAFVVIDMDIKQIKKADYRLFIRIKSMQSVPILALMGQSGVSDILNMLKMGVTDYLEKTKIEQRYQDKIEEMFRWYWYFKWKENQKKWLPEINKDKEGR